MMKGTLRRFAALAITTGFVMSNSLAPLITLASDTQERNEEDSSAQFENKDIEPESKEDGVVFIDTVDTDVVEEDQAIVWQKPSEDWYEDYEYTISDNSIFLNKSNGLLSGNIVIPNNVTIDGKNYDVVLDVKQKISSTGLSYPARSLWYDSRRAITGIKIEPGVIANDCCGLFAGMSSMEYIDITGLKTDGVTNMKSMFEACSINQVDLSRLNTSSVTDMESMFEGTRIKQVNLNCLDTSNVTNMSSMFKRCRLLQEISMESIDTSMVQDMSDMFYYCVELKEVDVSNFDTSNVTNMKGMFEECRLLKKIDITGFDTSKVENMGSLFRGCNSLESIDTSNMVTSSATVMWGMFAECEKLQEIDVSRFDTSNVSSMACMFGNCKSLESLNLCSFNTENVTGMAGMFIGCSNIKHLDLSMFETGNVEEMSGMFGACGKLEWLDISNFDLSKVQYYPKVSNMGFDDFFINDSSLTYIKTPRKMHDSLSANLPIAMRQLNEDGTRGSAVYYDLNKAPANTILVSDSYVPKIEIIEFEEKERIIKVGDDTKLNVNLSPQYATVGNLIWTSSNSDVATVSGNNEYALVKGIKKGEAVISVSEPNGLKAECIVTVKKKDGPAAPIGLTSTPTSYRGASDGKINGVDPSMEYANSAEFIEVKKCTSSVITGIKAGEYYVRYSETEDTEAGLAVSIIVEDAQDSVKDTTWQDDFEYDIVESGSMEWPQNTIVISRYNGMEENYRIPSEAIINGVKYNVGILNDVSNPNDNRYMDWGNLNNISFEKGVIAPRDCSFLFYKTTCEKIDLSGLDTSNVTNMACMFYDSPNWLREVCFGDIDTSKVTDMSEMFYNSNVAEIDISMLDTRSVENMSHMFEFSGIRSINMSNIRTDKLTNVSSMFNLCGNLYELNMENVDLCNVQKYDSMFFDTNKMIYFITPINVQVHIDLATKYEDIHGTIYDCVPKNIKESIWLTKTGYEKPAEIETIDISESSIKMKVGDSKELIATLKPENAKYRELEWTSSRDDVVAITGNGKKAILTAKEEGKAVITVKAENGVKASCEVSVSAEELISDDSPMNPVEPIDEDTTEIYLVKGQKFTLSESGWVSSDNKTMAISKKNVLTAKNVTTAPVKLTKGDRSIDVFITKPAMTAKSITVWVGSSHTMSFNYDDEHLKVQWYSNAPDIATVSDEGKVTAVGKGTATITAYVNGSAYTCKVKVKEDIPATDRTLHMTLNGKKTISIKGIKKVTWIPDDDKIVSVTKKNKIKAEAIGETILRTEYEGKEYRIHVYVEDPTIVTKDIQSTGKNKYKLTLAPNGSSTIEFSSIEQPVIFKSSKGETAYVDADGTIHANRPGKAKLTCKINGKTITINVTVQ